MLFIQVVPDTAYNNLVDEIIRRIVKEWKEDGMEIRTYAESLIIMETERLTIRKLTRKDLERLFEIMNKPEVMYAWEHGFTKRKYANG